MNKFVFLVIALVFPLGIRAADDAVSAKDLDGIKWSVGFGGLRNGYQGGFGFVTPTFLSFGKESYNDLSAYIDAGFINLPDSFLNSSGNFEDTSNFNVGFGVRSATRFSQVVQSYVKLGADYIGWDSGLKTISGRSSSWATFFGFGSDFFMNEKNNPFGSKNESVFVDVGIRYGHARTDSVSGSPSLFSGLGVNFGYRMHY